MDLAEAQEKIRKLEENKKKVGQLISILVDVNKHKSIESVKIEFENIKNSLNNVKKHNERGSGRKKLDENKKLYMVKVNEINEILKNDNKISSRRIAEKLNISHTTVCKALKYIKIKRT